MPLESLSVRFSGINSASNGIGGGTGCNLYFFTIKYEYFDQSLVRVAYSFHMIYEYTTPGVPNPFTVITPVVQHC